jgi:hypothetical protein
MKITTLRTRSACLGVFLSFMVPSLPAVMAQTNVAYVLDIGGQWQVEGAGQNLQRGNSLRANARVRASATRGTSTFIIIANLNGNIIARKYCRDSGACDSPIQLPAAAAAPSLISRVFGTVISLWGGNSSKYGTLGSRDAARALKEGVALLKDGQVDLTAALNTLPKDTYRLRFVTIPCVDLALCKTILGPVDVMWEPGKPALIPAGDLKSGLYEVQLLRKNAGPVVPTEKGTEAWVLVSPPANYDAQAAAFAAAKDLTKSWQATMQSMNQGESGKTIKGTTVSSFLRATLDHLAAEPQQPDGSK